MCRGLRTLEPMSSVAPQALDIKQVLASVIDGRPADTTQEVDSSVAALVTVEQDLTYLSDTLAALVAQTVLPGVIIIADCSGSTAEPLYSEFQVLRPRLTDRQIVGSRDPCTVEVQVVRAKGASSFGDAIGKALGYARLPQMTRGLWLLHDDARPMDPNCLETLIESWHRSPTVSILGAKQFNWEGEGLQDVGRYAYRHSTVGLVVDQEPDQEQYDSRQDVFSVSLAGSLVPLETLKNLRGLERWSGTFGQSDDLCRRICLSGGRVVVVPEARIAHAQARFRGLRDRAGRPIDQESPTDSSMAAIDARERYLLTDFPAIWWLPVWIWRLLAAVWFALASLINKRPYTALCHLCAPWRLLGHLRSSIMMRRRLASVSVTGLNHLDVLQANRQQVRQWHQRQQAFRDQLDHPLIGHLALAHLKEQRTRRTVWALGMTVLVLFVLLATNWSTCQAVFSGGSIYSKTMLSSGADWNQLVSSATTSWTWGSGTGMPAAPTPFLLVLMVFSALTGGHVAWAMALMLLVEVPLSALSFWALAGIFTRSNPVRVAVGLLWSCLSLALGVVESVNLPILTVLAFMPVAFAFVFKAVGLYRTESPSIPHASIQDAALAAICFMPVILAEPQLLLALIPIFIIVFCVVPRHKAMLMLIPIPSALALAPTLVNLVRHFHDGLWRQLFGDVTVPSSLTQGQPRSDNLGDMVAGILDLDVSQGWLGWLHSGDWQGLILMGALLVLVLLAFISLFLPAVVSASRMMWAMALIGVVLAMVSSSITVSLDQTGPVAGSPLPGLLLVLLSLMACICLVAGGAVKPFRSLAARGDKHTGVSIWRTGESGVEAIEDGSDMNPGSTVTLVLVRVGRGLLTLALVAVMAALALGSRAGGHESAIRADSDGLPMVAVDYLSKADNHRVLVLSAPGQNQVMYGSMRTFRGDLIDVSPAARAQAVAGSLDPATEGLSSAGASLIVSADSSAIETIDGLGYGGIYVPSDAGGSTGGATTPNENLVSNITASDGTQQVVSNAQGTYFRLTLNTSSKHGVDMSAYQAVVDSPWRAAWLWTLGLALVAYCLVALPHRRSSGQEQ